MLSSTHLVTGRVKFRLPTLPVVETALINCGHSSSTFSNCDHDKDVGVWCFDATEGKLAKTYEYRLNERVYRLKVGFSL